MKNPKPNPELLRCMDLLYFGEPGEGDIAEDDLEAACFYEYGRESDVLREAAAEYKASVARWERECEHAPAQRIKRIKRTKGKPKGGGPPDVIEVYHAISEKFERPIPQNSGVGLKQIFDSSLQSDPGDEWSDTWFMGMPWNSIWMCPGFPDKGWLALTKGERADIRCAFMVPGAQPLLTHDLTLLDAMGVLERLQSMSKLPLPKPKPESLDTEAQWRVSYVGEIRKGDFVRDQYGGSVEIQDVRHRKGKVSLKGNNKWSKKTYHPTATMECQPERPRKRVPIVQGWPKQNENATANLFHVLFTLDFKKSRELLRTEFDAWLVSSEIKALRDVHEAVIRGATGKFKDRLKRLGVLRLARGFQDDCGDTYSDAALNAAIEFADANRKLDSSGQPRAFSDYRTGQTEKVPKNTAPLYNEPSAMRKAVRAAEQHLAELIPAWKRKGA